MQMTQPVSQMNAMQGGAVLGLGAAALGGAWKCLNCGYYTPMVSGDNEDGSIPTCGQRKTQYCAGPCQNMTNFEWATQGYALPPQQMQQMQARQLQQQQQQQSPQLSAQSPKHPQLPDISQFTEDELVELKSRIEKALASKKQCDICCEAPKVVIFYPCKHKVACKACGEKVTACPQCRQDIADRIVPFE